MILGACFYAKDDPSKCFSHIATKVTCDSVQSTTNTITILNADNFFLRTKPGTDSIPDGSLLIGALMNRSDNGGSNELDEDELMKEDILDFDFDIDIDIDIDSDCGTSLDELEEAELMETAFLDFDFDCGTTLDDLIG